MVSNNTALKPQQALNKAYRKVKPLRDDIEKFKTNLITLLDSSNDTESEEFHKNLVADFLKKNYYDPNHSINTKGRNDLVIHNGPNADSSVGVIIEAKKPTNTAEMPSKGKLNTKAMQELVLYFLRERVTEKNTDVKHLIVSNIYEWYIFDAQEFDRAFAQDKKLVKQFEDFESGSLSGTKTDFFYKEIAGPALLAADLTYTYFDFRKYEKVLRNKDKKDDRKLIALYKLLSPEHLLKLPFANDSNSLDKKFYAELLHIIGLAEVKDGGKKLIQRPAAKDRNKGALLENAILQIDALDKLSRVDNLSSYGTTKDEKLFGVGLELVITWINRVLFLKLLEGQLIAYNKGDSAFRFMSGNSITDFDGLNALFFQVLARKHADRSIEISETYGHVPYLNSSLFEPQDIEHNGLFISELQDNVAVPLLSNTVLKDQNGKKRKGEMPVLEYLFAFLDAYDFASEGTDDIQEDNKQLINASVLGLIFEKINGYKDGSFFTPGFITMYMCRETIRRAVLQKFEEAKGWKCETIDQLYEKIEDKIEANELINSLKICDPAVGSGHFLVSALNEIIAIKSELKILVDRQGKTLRDYEITVENDELVVTNDDQELYEYHYGNAEAQRVQETLFHEKQNIIENCLFGVDINPNSVKICRLRLWIELLKNAYYKAENVLETLPNIDINIKCGNSLISRFGLDADIKKALKKSKYSIDAYRVAVHTYRNAADKDEKRAMQELIDTIKGNFRSEISKNDPKVIKLKKLNGELYTLTNQVKLFKQSVKEKKAWKSRTSELIDSIKRLDKEIEEIKSNKIFENAFEWRFEFPEVLDDDGAYVGFDVVIGNPPYIRHEEFSDLKPYLEDNFTTYKNTADLYVYFIERAFQIASKDAQFSYIVPNKWLKAGYGRDLRIYLQKLNIKKIIDFGDLPVFEEATTYPSILYVENNFSKTLFQSYLVKTLNYNNDLTHYLANNVSQINRQLLNEEGWILSSLEDQNLLDKIKAIGISLREYVGEKIYYGIKTGYNKAFVVNKKVRQKILEDDPTSDSIIKPFLSGKDIRKYGQPSSENYLILFKSGDTKSWFGELTEEKAWFKLQKKHPAICNHLFQFKEKAKNRSDQGQYWWELRACSYYNEFEKNKIIWPGISSEINAFAFDENQNYGNDNNQLIITEDLSLLGILNSKVVKYYISNVADYVQGGFIRLKMSYVMTVPIPKQSLTESEHKISQKVTQILALKKEEPEANTTALEAEIDAMVYALYGLSAEEIAIVEESVK